MTITESARDAAIFADAVEYALLAASTPNASREQTRAQLVRAFTAWPSLCRRMSKLAELAPTSAAEGQAQAEKLADIAERAGA